MEVTVIHVDANELQNKIQEEKNKGKRILALAPLKIVRGEVKIYTLVTQ